MNNILLKSYLRCKRKAWLDLWGDKSLRNWSAQKSIHLITEFKNFHKFTQGDLFQGEKGCEKGFKGVIGLKIKDKLSNGLEIEIQPSLLVKTKGKSIWGKYKYLPAISKLGRRTTKEHLLDIALCSILLEKTQKGKVENGLIISCQKNKINLEKISIDQKLKDKSINLFTELNSSLKDNIPSITENRKKCSICSWKNFCDNEAKSIGLLTDVDGIGTKTAQSLKNIGINSVQQLATADKYKLTEKLFDLKTRDPSKIDKFINQSKSLISGLPIDLKNIHKSSDIFIRIKKGFFVFDIESNPDENHDFLYGFLSADNIKFRHEDCKYQPILNLTNKDNEKFNSNIFEKIYSKENWPILHYGETEKINLIKLAKINNFSSEDIEKLKSRFIDLHLIIRESWILPIKNYSLKSVANYIGFKWKQKNVSGSRALFWWIQFKNTNENSFLDKIINYNKDDCFATLEIAKWYVNNAEKFLNKN